MRHSDHKEIIYVDECTQSLCQSKTKLRNGAFLRLKREMKEYASQRDEPSEETVPPEQVWVVPLGHLEEQPLRDE